MPINKNAFLYCWTNNGNQSLMISKEEQIPHGFVLGRGKFYGVSN